MTGTAAAGLATGTAALSGTDPASVGLVVGLVLLSAVVLTLRALRRRPTRRPASRPSGPRPSDRTVRTRPQVGDVWWAQVPFEDGTGSKDRPCVVVDTHGLRCVVLYVTSTDRSGRPGWLAMPRQGWSPRPGTSWLRTDRRIVLDADALRRYAGPCPPQVRKTLHI